jgi:hypothetical protein
MVMDKLFQNGELYIKEKNEPQIAPLQTEFRNAGINYFALQELNISPNHFHLPDRTSWVPFLLARRCILLAPGNRTSVNVEPCIVKYL